MARCTHARRFHQLVNMSPREIRSWAKDPRATCYSNDETRARLPKLAALKAKPVEDWTAADCKYAARVVSFNARMSGALRRDGCTPGYTIALRNWGHKPKCAVPKTCSRSEFSVSGLGKSATPVESAKLVSVDEALERIGSRWPKAQVRALPHHVKPFAEFMAGQRDKDLTPRDVVKAYVITRSSVQRQAVAKTKVCKAYPEYAPLPRAADLASVRPEDVMAQLFFTPSGQEYLDAAQRGLYDAEAATDLAERFVCFGLVANKGGLIDDMKYAANLAKRTGEVKAALKTDRLSWWKYVDKNIKGIATAKAGFFASMLGRGDIPTFDAREISLWAKDEATKEQLKTTMKWDDVEKLREKILSVPIELPARYEPFRAHLVHHILWDAWGEDPKSTKKSKKGAVVEPKKTPRTSRTTHGGPIRAMQFAGTKKRSTR